MGKPVLLDLTGHRYGRLTVLEYVGRYDRKTLWKVRCDCGNETEARSSTMRSGGTTSCGCAGSRNTIGERRRTHGKSSHPLFRIWAGMNERCSNPYHVSFKNYGGRGIRVCKKWKNDFQAFLDDMEPTWKHGLQIERKDNDGNYSPRNCKWATRYEQMQNCRSNHIVETPWGRMTVTTAAAQAGLDRNTLTARLRKGCPKSRLFDPAKRKGSASRNP